MVLVDTIDSEAINSSYRNRPLRGARAPWPHVRSPRGRVCAGTHRCAATRRHTFSTEVFAPKNHRFPTMKHAPIVKVQLNTARRVLEAVCDDGVVRQNVVIAE